MRFQDEDGNDVFHSFEDFLEVGSPMGEDSEEELEPSSDFAWFEKEELPIETKEVFAEFKDGKGDSEFVSLFELNMSGTPIDTETDKEMDLASEDVFRKHGEEFLAI